MNNFSAILRAHAKRYPMMRPCDAVKLIYQSTFGGGHLIPDEKTAHTRLLAEYASVQHIGKGLRCESLGDTARVYIDSKLDNTELELVSKMFCTSAKRFCRGYSEADVTVKQAFDRRLSALEVLCREGVFSFSEAELESYIAEYRTLGCPAVSHSEVYREQYKPAYRVIDAKLVRLIPALLRIAAALDNAKPFVLAIDGRCASGKTTAAELICGIFGGETVHTDDFFLPPELRTRERLNEIGGNLHRERFLEEVVPYLRDREGFSHRVFDCSVFEYAKDPRVIRPSRLTVCEGSYALHPDFGKYYDMAIFSDITPEEQTERILHRNGEYMLSRFKSEWIPMEERYFNSFGIRSICDLVL